jgi:hypothetical protein
MRNYRINVAGGCPTFLLFPSFVSRGTNQHTTSKLEETELKFKLKRGKGSVSEFIDAAGNRFKPGDTIDLPKSYSGEKWLEQVKSAKPEVKLQDLEASPKKKTKTRKPKSST